MAGTDFSHLTTDELIKGIKALKLPDYIRSKAYGIDVRETLAQMTEMTIQLGVNMGLSPDDALKWARKLQESVSQSEFDSWVATLLDGGPSIFMNTLSELQTTYPNGAAGVALVRETDPAKIYVWNGTTWEDFGDYQGIEIKDGTVTPVKTDFYNEIALDASNIISNGNFMSDSNGDGVADRWSANGAGVTQPRVEGNSQYWTPTSTYVWLSSISQSVGVGVNPNHKYYISLEGQNIANLTFGGGNDYILSGRVNGKVSKIVQPPSGASGNHVIIYTPEANVESFIKDFILIDLTKTFGIGNEPTLDEFEILLERNQIEYLEGSVNLSNPNKNTLFSGADLRVNTSSNVTISDKFKELIKPQQTTFIKQSENLFNPNGEVIKGGYFHANGTWVESSVFETIVVEGLKPNTTYQENIEYHGLVSFVTEDMVNVGGLYPDWTEFKTPNNPLFSKALIAYNKNSTSISSTMITEGPLPSVYVPYSLTLDERIKVNANNSRLPNNEILVFGDSIAETAGINDDGSGYSEYKTNWPTYARDILGMTVRNYAKSGASYSANREQATGDKRLSILNQIDMAIANGENPSLIVFSAGTNDNGMVGSFDVAMGKENLADLDTSNLYEAVRYAYWYTRQNFPEAIIFTGTPIQRAAFASTNGYKKSQRDAIVSMGNKYNAKIVDATFESGIISEFETQGGVGRYLGDGTHPNEKGKELLGKLYARVIKNTINIYG